jgi:Tfp pilus assembly protein PilF
MHDLETLLRIGTKHHSDRRYRAAKVTFKRALSKVGSDEHLRFIIINNIGAALCAQKQYKAAHKIFSDALKGKEYFKYTLTTRGNLAWTCIQLGEFDHADGILRQSLNHFETQSDPIALDLRSKLGSLLYHQRNFSEATNIFQDVLEVRRVVSGPRHPHTITTMSNLAGCLKRQKKYREAQEIIEEAIAAIFPQEIWIQIVQNLNPRDTLSAYKAGLPWDHKKVQHARAWTKVFRRFEWLDAAVRLHGHPVLIGEGAKRLYDEFYSEEPIYLVFLSLCWDGNDMP